MILLRERFQEPPGKDSRKILNSIPLRPVWNVPKVQRLTPRVPACQALNWERKPSGWCLADDWEKVVSLLRTQLCASGLDLVSCKALEHVFFAVAGHD